MRIISGNLRGKKLLSPDNENIRPTSDRVKEGFFSSIQFEIENTQALDLFCGSGQLGLESLSRGANHCTFIDNDKRSCELALKNITACRMNEQSRVITQDYAGFLKSTSSKFDLAILDPPYKAHFIDKALLLVSEKMSDIGVIVLEHDHQMLIPEQLSNGFAISRQKKYGKTKITLYRKVSE